jgi:hypothetical protein
VIWYILGEQGDNLIAGLRDVTLDAVAPYLLSTQQHQAGQSCYQWYQQLPAGEPLASQSDEAGIMERLFFLVLFLSCSFNTSRLHAHTSQVRYPSC